MLSIRMKRVAAGPVYERRASIALVGAAVIAMLAGLGAVAVDLGTAYLAKVADHARRTDGLCRGARLNASSSIATMSAAVANLAALNGLPVGSCRCRSCSLALWRRQQRGPGHGDHGPPLFLAKVVQSSSTLSVSATSYAEVKPSASACIIALKAGGTGVTLSGGML